MTERRYELRRIPWQVRDSGQLLLVVAAGVVGRAALRRSRRPPGNDPDDSLADGEKPV